MIVNETRRIISWPLRPFINIFRRGARMGSNKSARKAGVAVGAAGKAAIATASKTAAKDILQTEYHEEAPSGVEAAMFKQLPRPRLTERVAADLTLEEAQRHSAEAERFYEFEFPLFPRGDFFYEEIEEEYLNAALGYDADSIDRRFIDVATLFRRTLNGNTRRLMFYWAPLIGLTVFGAATFKYLQSGGFSFAARAGPWAEVGALYGGAALLAAFLAFLVYSWPYKVVQQRNLLNLDNYVTSKFARYQQ